MLIWPKVLAANRWPDSPCSPLFYPNVPNSFCALQTPPSYVCWTLLRLIKHFMLTWHFLQGVAVTLFWLWHFPGWAGLQVDIRPETFWQGLLAGQFASPAKTLPVSCQDFWTWWSWSYHDHSFQTHYQFLHLTRTKRYQERMRISICSVQLAVDNTICGVLAQLIAQCISIFEILCSEFFLRADKSVCRRWPRTRRGWWSWKSPSKTSNSPAQVSYHHHTPAW